MKRIFTTISLVLAAFTAQANNEIYVEQIGSGLVLDITQTGSGNKLGTASTPASIQGNNNVIEISQIGNDNTMAFKIDSYAAEVSMSVIGSSNTVDFKCGADGTACGGHKTNLNIEGSSNMLTATVTANDVTNSINIHGDSNIMNMSISSRATNTFNVTGSDNSITSVQSGVAGVLGHSITLNHTGNNSSFDITQSGSVDNAINLLNIGSNVNITIKQSN